MMIKDCFLSNSLFDNKNITKQNTIFTKMYWNMTIVWRENHMKRERWKRRFQTRSKDAADLIKYACSLWAHWSNIKVNHGRDMLTFQPIEVIKGPTGSLSAIPSTAKKSHTHKKILQTFKTRINNVDNVSVWHNRWYDDISDNVWDVVMREDERREWRGRWCQKGSGQSTER